MMLRFSLQCIGTVCFLLFAGSGWLRAEVPLHQQIDALIGFGNSQFDKTAAVDVDDATFMRRITLDLAGSIPSSQQVQTFLADKSADKRTKLIDQLLASPQHARRLQYLFDTMLMERRPGKNVPETDWTEYLRKGFLQNKPWDKLVQEILTADGVDKESRPAAKFLLDRQMKINDVTRDLGRIFLGRDMQCAQCHDHPSVDDYMQRHYHGLAAFMKRSFLFKDPKTKLASIGEKAEGNVEFTSVFTDETGKTAPRMLNLPEIKDPPMAKEPYKVKPTKKVRSVPVYSRRLQLASAMTDRSNVAFRRNIANRLWAMMMGRGIVEPLDMWHSYNPPTHPKLIDLMADDFQSHHYDIRYFLRELALSKTYQRSSQMTVDPGEKSQINYSVSLLKPLSPEQLAWSIMQATGQVDVILATLKTKQLQKEEKQNQASKKAGKEPVASKVDDPLWQEEALHGELQGYVKMFVSTFGFVGAQTSRYDAAANQALYLRNGATLQIWLAPSKKNLTARLKELKKPEEIASEMYLSVFSRPPAQQEIEAVAQFLSASKKDRDSGLRQLVWAALVSDEFRFNH